MGSIYIREEAEEYWKGLSEAELRIQKCKQCKRFTFYPRQFCPYDMGELDYERVSGKGKVLSYTVVEKTPNRDLAKIAPFVMAIIELQEGPTMLSRVVDAPIDQTLFDKEVEVIYEKTNEVNLPLFRLV